MNMDTIDNSINTISLYLREEIGSYEILIGRIFTYITSYQLKELG